MGKVEGDMCDKCIEYERVLKFYAKPEHWNSPSTGFALQYDPEPSPIRRRGDYKLAEQVLHTVKIEDYANDS
jgi:hypothetical protein